LKEAYRGFSMVRKLIITLAALMLIPLSVSASSGAKSAVDWTSYHEPSENAFTAEIPKGWQVQAGTARRTASVATPWLRATSVDGLTTIFQGDPSIPKFVLPGTYPSSPEGKSITGPGGTTVVARYQTGKEFASTYGPHMLPAGCESVKLLQSQDEPKLEQLTHQKNPGLTASISAGSALFSYDLHGRNEVAEIVAQSMLTPMGTGGNWGVFDIHGFQTRSGNELQARGLVEHMHTTMTVNPEWMASMMKARNAEASQFSSMLQQQNQQFTQWSRNQTQQFNQRMNVQHTQAMNTIQAIGDRGRAQAQADAQWHADAMVNHYAQMAAKDNNTYKQVLQIQGKHLEWSPDLQRNVEVPNY